MGHARILRVASVLFLLLGVLVVPAAGAAASAPSTYEGNATCEAFDLMPVYKADFDDAPAAGTDPSGRVGWVVYEADSGQAVDWTSTVPIAAVLVKGGRVGGNLYAYEDVRADEGLHTPVNPSGRWADISHVTFCAEPEPEPEPATIMIEKQAPAAEEAVFFSFTSTVEGFAPSLGHGESISVDVEPGSYSISEPASEGWELTSIGCDGDYDDLQVDVQAATVHFVVAEGDLVSCTFTNVPSEPERGTLVIEKITDPYDPHPDFTFTTDVPGWAPVLSHGETSTMEVAAGTYTLTEDMTPRGSGTYQTKYWHLTSITCDDPDAVITIDDPEAGGSATVTVGEGETVTCTFTNEEKCPFNAKLIVDKVTEPSEATETFQFTSDIYWRSETPFSPVLGDGDSRWTWARPGTYTITEHAVEGWELASIVCDGGNAELDLAAGSATLDLVGGETVRCTFTNGEEQDELEPATLTVLKRTDPSDDGVSFEFTSTIGGFSPSLGHMESETADVDPGTYTVTEAAHAGWTLEAIDCDDPDAVLDLAAGSATVTLTEGEDVTCEFLNEEIEEEEYGTLVIEKVADPADTDIAFAIGYGPSGGDRVPVPLEHGESVSIDVAPGEYVVDETPDAADMWMVTDLTCDDPDGVVQLSGDYASAVVDVEAGEKVTCTFTNTQYGTLWVGKTTNPDTDDVYFDFTSDATGWSPSLHGGMSASTMVVPGTYTVTELATDGWQLTDVTCDDPDAVVDLTAGTVTVDVGAGDYVKCEFTNEQVVEPPLGAIGDYVWHDKNKNGIQDAGEPGIEGVRVNVYRTGNGVLATPPIVAPQGTLVATARTDSTGHYLIEDVPAGQYVVEFTGLPAGFRWTKRLVGDRALDSDADLTTGQSPVMVIPAGFVDLTCDAGAYLVQQDVLPDTGADLETPFAAGLVLLLTGATLLGVARRREST